MAMNSLLGYSITYRIAVDPQAGRKVFSLQTLLACDEPFDDGARKVARFSLQAGVAARAEARTAVPVHKPPGSIREAAVVNTRRQRALPAQDTVPGWHHACDL
jgi:hypothetical protein